MPSGLHNLLSFSTSAFTWDALFSGEDEQCSKVEESLWESIVLYSSFFALAFGVECCWLGNHDEAMWERRNDVGFLAVVDS